MFHPRTEIRSKELIELNTLIKKYATLVLTDGKAHVPDELTHLPKESFTVAPMSDFIAKLESLVKQEHVVIVTDSESTARCAVALNMTLNSHYIIIVLHGVVDATDALKEFELYEKQLIDTDGKEYLLGERLVYPSVYATEDGRILVRTDTLLYNETGAVTETFYKNNNKKAGILLSEKFNQAAFTNTLSSYEPANVRAGFQLLHKLIEICGKGIPETLLMFGETICLVSVEDTPSDEAVQKFVYRVLFGADLTDDAAGHIISKLADEKLPDYLLDVIDQAFICKKALPLQLWKNIAERSLLEGGD